MALLQLPRIYFSGEISWDPGVTNNFGEVFDAAQVTLNVPPGMTLREFRQALPPLAADNGSWNHFGTHRAAFEQVKVTGASLDFAQPVVQQDPLIGRAITLVGKLVDLHARAVNGSQIFFDEFGCGDGAVGLRARSNRRMQARFINFARNRGGLPIAGNAGVLWQAVLHAQDIQITGAASSPVMTALGDALQRPGIGGLFVRFHAYRTLYFQNGIRNTTAQQPRTLEELAQLYLQGLNFSNPAYSAVVGLIGVWMTGEPASAPAGRFLRPVGGPLGPALVEIDAVSRRLVLDLGQTVPEQNAALDKADVGDIELLVDNDGARIPIKTIGVAEYARGAYESTAGIVEVDLAAHPDSQIAARIESGQLLVICRLAGAPIEALAEPRLRALADDQTVYLDEGETVRTPIRVQVRGVDAPLGTPVQVYELSGSAPADDAGVIVTGPGGVAQFQIAAVRPGISRFLFLPHVAGSARPPAPAAIDDTADAVVNVRTLPFDDALAQNTPDSTLTFDWIYENILGVYDALNPVMSRTTQPAINRPLDDPARMELFASSIKQATGKARFESARFMPVTRDLSQGRRLLLHRWCDLVLAGNTPEAAPLFLVSRASDDDPRVMKPTRRNR